MTQRCAKRRLVGGARAVCQAEDGGGTKVLFWFSTSQWVAALPICSQSASSLFKLLRINPVPFQRCVPFNKPKAASGSFVTPVPRYVCDVSNFGRLSTSNLQFDREFCRYTFVIDRLKPMSLAAASWPTWVSIDQPHMYCHL